MDDALKKRLVGAVVLVSLAVIFVPMLIEDEPVVSPGIKETNIPERPGLIPPVERQPPAPGSGAPADTLRRGTTDRPLALPLPEMVQPAPDGEEDKSAGPTGADAATVNAPPAAAAPAADSQPDEVPAGVPTAAEEPATARTPPPGPEPEARAAPAAPETEQPSGAPSGWVVQVGSFANRGNAETTLARLREAGFDSFQEEVRVGDKVLYRVKVGPEIDRARAEELRAQVADVTRLKGDVLQYP